MPVKRFTQLNSAKIQSARQPYISFHTRGRISITQSAIQILKLNAGDRVSFAQDEEDERVFYIYNDPESGFEIKNYTNKNKKSTLAVYSRIISRHVCNLYDNGRDFVSGRLIPQPKQIEGVDHYMIMLPKP